MLVFQGEWHSNLQPFSGVNIFKVWIFLSGEYFSGVSISQRWIFFRCEYFSGVNIFQGGIFFMGGIISGGIFLRGEYILGVNIFQGWIFFRGEYFSRVNIFQGWIFFRCEHFSIKILNSHRLLRSCYIYILYKWNKCLTKKLSKMQIWGQVGNSFDQTLPTNEVWGICFDSAAHFPVRRHSLECFFTCR